MKVLFIHHGVILGGAPLSLLYLARELERLPDMEIEIVCHSPVMQVFFSEHLKSPINSWVNPHTFIGKLLIGWTGLHIFKTNINAYRLLFDDLLKMPFSIWRQFIRLRKRKPDIVHLNSATLFGSAIAAKMAGIPIVWHIREPLQGSDFQRRLVGGFIRRMAEAVIPISEEEAARLGEDPEKKVHVIYNPINVEALDPQRYDQNTEKEKLGFKPTDKLVLSLGGVNPRKGTLEIVESAHFADEHTFYLIAGPPLPLNNIAESYEAKIEEKIIENRIIFTGNLEDIVPLLAASDVLVFAGMKPHFPRPAFEAWQMGKPVIVFEMPGVSSQVIHGVDGIIVGELTGQALGIALNKMLADPESMKRMGEAGRKKAEEKCNPISVARQVLSVYNEILS